MGQSMKKVRQREKEVTEVSDEEQEGRRLVMLRLSQQQQREYVWEQTVDRNSLGSLRDNECLWF